MQKIRLVGYGGEILRTEHSVYAVRRIRTVDLTDLDVPSCIAIYIPYFSQLKLAGVAWLASLEDISESTE